MTNQDLAINFTGKAGGPRMDMRVYIPNGAQKSIMSSSVIEPSRRGVLNE